MAPKLNMNKFSINTINGIPIHKGGDLNLYGKI